jgi:hypothetical protein
MDRAGAQEKRKQLVAPSHPPVTVMPTLGGSRRRPRPEPYLANKRWGTPPSRRFLEIFPSTKGKWCPSCQYGGSQRPCPSRSRTYSEYVQVSKTRSKCNHLIFAVSGKACGSLVHSCEMGRSAPLATRQPLYPWKLPTSLRFVFQVLR